MSAKAHPSVAESNKIRERFDKWGDFKELAYITDISVSHLRNVIKGGLECRTRNEILRKTEAYLNAKEAMLATLKADWRL